MSRINYKIIINLFGLLLLFNSGFMFLSTLVSLYFSDGVTLEFFKAGMIVFLIGSIFFFSTKNNDQQIQKKEVFLIVTLGWLLMICSGMLPFIFTDSIPQISHAFFETSSGYTATGASVVEDIENLPESILFWRSTTHWIGGMGIIV